MHLVFDDLVIFSSFHFTKFLNTKDRKDDFSHLNSWCTEVLMLFHNVIQLTTGRGMDLSTVLNALD